MTAALSFRAATLSDAPAMAEIYNQGIEDRVATFETRLRTASDVEGWFDNHHPIVVVEDEQGAVAGYAASFPYADRCCYAGVAEFSVYVRRSHRGRGVGTLAMQALSEAAAKAGLWKLLSRVFVENTTSLTLLRSAGFREVGVHEKHGKLDGVWRDVMAVEKLIRSNID